MSKADSYIKQQLAERQAAGNYRELKPETNLIDFCSNDYLGFARSVILKNSVDTETAQYKFKNGSTGSRLLAGNSSYAEQLESDIAALHGFEAGLIYNSGYDANLGLFSSLPQRGDTIIIDELAHASIIDGARLSYANRYSFKHNDLNSLEEKIKHARGTVYIAIESIYSMDGDTAPLKDIAAIARQHGAHLIVDEAHATGVFGLGLVEELNLQTQVFAKLITFGKALGCHGAIVLGNVLLRSYLINFSRSFIYTTAAPSHQLAAIRMAYRLLQQPGTERELLHHNIRFFKQNFTNKSNLIPGNSPIQCLLLKSNDRARLLADTLQANGFDVRPILSPTVAAGSERIRICLHSYNTEAELEQLLLLINEFTE